jgi:hypothetical protein
MSKNGVNCMAVVAPVEMDFSVPQGASALHICFSHIYAMGDGVDLEIAAIGPTGTKSLLSRVVPPLVNDDLPVWRNMSSPCLRILDRSNCMSSPKPTQSQIGSRCAISRSTERACGYVGF